MALLFYLPLSSLIDVCLAHLSFLNVDLLIMRSLQLLSSAVLWHYCDVITFSDVNLNDGVGDVRYNQCISNT